VTAKAGLIGLTRAIAVEFGNKGITANIVVPGSINTTRNEKDYPNFEQQNAMLMASREQGTIAIPRQGTTEEVAHGVMFFASEKASYLTAQQLYVAGGLWTLP